MKKNNKKQETNAKAATVKAVVYALDAKQNHSMRKRLESTGCDAMVLHAFDKISTTYFTLCLALAAAGKAIVGEMVTLFCNGVTERVSYDAATGNYSRVVGNGKQLFGNVKVLIALYGKDSVALFNDAAIATAFTSQKEQTTRKLGDGRTITGRVIAQGKKGDMVLDVVAVKLDNGKIALFNLEDKTNTHQRKQNRFAIVQTTNAKAATVKSRTVKAKVGTVKADTVADTAKVETVAAVAAGA